MHFCKKDKKELEILLINILFTVNKKIQVINLHIPKRFFNFQLKVSQK